jgi:bifunctional UDP-N-acetylglucosamine pyrophosphorylase/glucosamine-1-phosphate N-acetyltransferase
MAAGKGSRMKGFEGNKTLLPLVPEGSPFVGRRPILAHILESLPPGPKAVVVNHRKEDVIAATRSFGLTYCEQPVVNGTGGALLAAGEFLRDLDQTRLIVTMGDVPFVRPATYLRLLEGLAKTPLMVLGFRPPDKRQYGVLEIEGAAVRRITEWKYWRTYPPERQARLEVCNAGIYAARRADLLGYLPALEKRPHVVLKERNGTMVEVEEFFITDLVELMQRDGLGIGYSVARDGEVMGVDDLASLQRAQALFQGAP